MAWRLDGLFWKGDLGHTFADIAKCLALNVLLPCLGSTRGSQDSWVWISLPRKLSRHHWKGRWNSWGLCRWHIPVEQQKMWKCFWCWDCNLILIRWSQTQQVRRRAWCSTIGMLATNHKGYWAGKKLGWCLLRDGQEVALCRVLHQGHHIKMHCLHGVVRNPNL